MSVDFRWLRRAGILTGLLLAALTVLVLPASPASAHAVLVGSTPQAQVVLPQAPDKVVLTFSEAVRSIPDKIRVIGPDGKRVDKGEPVFSGGTVTISVENTGARGTYLVSYRVISADSHPVAGGYPYSVGEPSATPVAGDDSAEAHPVIEAAMPVTRYIGYAGLVLAVGPVLMLALLWPERLSRRGPTRVAYAGLGLVALGALAAMLFQAPYTTGGSLAGTTAGDLKRVVLSPFGAAHLVRLGVLVSVALLLRPTLRGSGGRIDRALLVFLAFVGLATWPVAGHPAASPVPAVSVVADAVHLASMATWLGGLGMLVVFLLRRADDRELGAILPVWSRWAALAVTALLLAGTIQGLIEVNTPGALVGTTYGRLILAKIALFAAVIAVAAYSRQLVRRRIAEEQPGRIRKAVVAELGITAVVLALSATLVQTTPARTADAATAPTTGIDLYATTLRSKLYSLQIEVDPAKVGNNSVHLYAYTLDNKPLPVVEWKATAALPSAGVEPVEIPLLPILPNHTSGDVSLPTAGQWQLRFTLRTSEIDQATVTAVVPVK